MEKLSIVISIFALTISTFIGLRQVKISEMQNEMQNKVELYLLAQPITFSSEDEKSARQIVPAIYVRNLGANVVYLEKYVFNGKEYQLGKNILPPVSAYDGFRYIFLPTNGETHVSFTIDFLDWKNNKWQTSGYADLINGVWDITYSPCVKRKEKE